MSKYDQNPTGFRRWRHRMGYTLADAAVALGVAASTCQNWDIGFDRGTKKPAAPSLAHRVLMRLLADDRMVEPWPE
jgi:DNA-binding transcriptional regulator YiaG